MSSQVVITDGGWHRIGLVSDGLLRTFCVDDVIVAEDIQSVLKVFAGGLYIGVGSNYAAGTFFSGLIDDVRIYSRVVMP
ncbi:MAG: LamG-like jellyroll fold domain-containing protein [Planctomycetota bacterium]